MSTPSASASASASAASPPELCAKAHRQGTHPRKAPLSGAAGSFEVVRNLDESQLAQLAERQQWCLHRRQLEAAGVGRRGIAGRIKRSQLSPLLSDVFLYGHRERSRHTMAVAVALHLRGDGLISHEHATWIWELTDLQPESVIATLVGRRTHRLDGVVIHHVAALDPRDIRWHDGLPLTAPARSLIDFAGTGASLIRVESALAMFRRRYVTADNELVRALSRVPANHPGAPLIRRLLKLPPGELILTRSIYERKLTKLLRGTGIPMPLINQLIAGHERDLAWPDVKLIVEFDGYIWHRDRFREDRARDAAAAAQGWRVIRLTADRIDTEPEAVLAELALAIGA